MQTRGGTWDMVPVIPSTEHTGWATELGFAAVRMALVDDNGSDKRIEFQALNNKLASTALPGGNTNYGLSTGSPRLVN